MTGVSRTIRIGSSNGLHARPAKLFAQAVKDAGIPVTVAKGAGAPVNAASQSMTAYHDRDAFSAMNSILKGTGAFASVGYDLGADLSAVGADQFPLASIEPTGWTETPDSDPSYAMRSVTFNLRLAVRDLGEGS